MSVVSGYCSQAASISVETDRFEFALLRQKSNCDRIQMSSRLTQEARQLCLYGLRHTHASLTESEEFTQLIAQAFLGDPYPSGFIPTGTPMTWIQDSIALALQLQEIFTALDIPHYITGGVAAATYGEPRTTRDLDMVIALSPVQLDHLVQRLEATGFYVPGVEDFRSQRLNTLSITHQETIARADLMLAETSDFAQGQFNRRRAISIPNRGTLYLSAPEDLILNKLCWGAHSQSEKQWRDVLGILKIQGQTLEFDYLNDQAQHLAIARRLHQAMIAAGLSVR